MSYVLAAATIAWTAPGLAAAVFIVAPGPTSSTWLLGVMTEGYSLVVSAIGLLGGVLAVLTIVYGSTAVGVVGAAFAVSTLVLSLVPVVAGFGAGEATRSALAEGARLPSGVDGAPRS